MQNRQSQIMLRATFCELHTFSEIYRIVAFGRTLYTWDKGQRRNSKGGSAMEEILAMEHITKTYPGVKALDDVSISFIQGEVHAVMGENGAGKSTLMKILNGMIPADSGDIRFHGRKSRHPKSQRRKSLGDRHDPSGAQSH